MFEHFLCPFVSPLLWDKPPRCSKNLTDIGLVHMGCPSVGSLIAVNWTAATPTQLMRQMWDPGGCTAPKAPVHPPLHECHIGSRGYICIAAASQLTAVRLPA